MTDTTAKIRAKGCETTGLTEDLARKLWDAGAGKHFMAVVELRVEEPHGPNSEGKRRLDLVIDLLEPAVHPIAEDHLRNFQRSLYYERKLLSEGDQPTLESVDDAEPSVEARVAEQASVVHHDFVREGKTGNCEVCGNDPFHYLHADDPDPDPDEASEAAAEDAHEEDLEPATTG